MKFKVKQETAVIFEPPVFQLSPSNKEIQNYFLQALDNFSPQKNLLITSCLDYYQKIKKVYGIFYVVLQQAVLANDDKLFGINHPTVELAFVTVLKKFGLPAVKKIFSELNINEEMCINYTKIFIRVRQDCLQEMSLKNWFLVTADSLRVMINFEANINGIRKIVGISEENFLLQSLKELPDIKYVNINDHEHVLSVQKNFLEKKLMIHSGFKNFANYSLNQPIEKFIDALNTYGYFLTGGFFGNDHHSEACFSQKIANMSIYSWKKGTFEPMSLIKPIVIIGASSNKAENFEIKQDLVYFIMATDTTVPAPIYMVSYQAFKERLVSIQGYNNLFIDYNNAQLDYFYYHPDYAPHAPLASKPALPPELERNKAAKFKLRNAANPKSEPDLAQILPAITTLNSNEVSKKSESSSTAEKPAAVTSITSNHAHWGTVFNFKYLNQPTKSENSISNTAKPSISLTTTQTNSNISLSNQNPSLSTASSEQKSSQVDTREGGRAYQNFTFDELIEQHLTNSQAPIKASGLLLTVQNGLNRVKKLDKQQATYPYALRMILIRMIQALALHAKLENKHFTFDDCQGFTLSNILTHCYYKISPEVLEKTFIWVNKYIAKNLEKFIKTKKKSSSAEIFLCKLPLYTSLSATLTNYYARESVALIEDIINAFENIEKFKNFGGESDEYYAVNMNLIDAVECYNNFQKQGFNQTNNLIPLEVKKFLCECRYLIRNPERHVFNS
jgi:hypothetical protein